MSDREKMGWILVAFFTGLAGMLSFTAITIAGKMLAPLAMMGWNWFMGAINKFLELIATLA